MAITTLFAEIEAWMQKRGLGWAHVQQVLLGNRYGEKKRSVPEVLLTYDGFRNALSYSFDDGYGGEEAHDIYVYFEDWILFKSVYDGSECLCEIPRNPNHDYLPQSYGGG